MSERLEAKIDALSERVSDIDRAVAGLTVQDGEHRKNIERFWAESWAPFAAKLEHIDMIATRMEGTTASLASDMTELKTRVASLENRIGTDHERRIRGLEQSRARLMGLAAAGGGGFAAFVQWLVRNVGG